jgi:type I restriction enzyme S subunit
MAIYKLGELCKVRIGKTPSTKNEDFWKEGSIKWYTGKEVSNGNHNCLKTTKKAIIDNIQPITTNNCILLSMVRYIEPLIPEENCTYNQNVACLHVNQNIIKKHFLFYMLNKAKSEIKKTNLSTSTFPRINSTDIKNIKLNLPIIEEQEKIIEIIKPLEDSIMNIKNQINETKKLLINEYNLLDTSRNFLQDYIKNHTRKYSGQTKYLATNAIGEFSIDSHKAQDISNQKPSRANLTPENNSIIVSKLDGENKMMYIDDAFKYVVSTGFFNFSTNHLDHLVGFLLSNDFKKQKSMLSTGTTMVGLNNSGLKRIKISSPINKNNTLTNHLNRLILTEIKLSKQKDKIINLLIK